MKGQVRQTKNLKAFSVIFSLRIFLFHEMILFGRAGEEELGVGLATEKNTLL